jgi:chromosome segregation ATPase
MSQNERNNSKKTTEPSGADEDDQQKENEGDIMIGIIDGLIKKWNDSLQENQRLIEQNKKKGRIFSEVIQDLKKQRDDCVQESLQERQRLAGELTKARDRQFKETEARMTRETASRAADRRIRELEDDLTIERDDKRRLQNELEQTHKKCKKEKEELRRALDEAELAKGCGQSETSIVDQTATQPEDDEVEGPSQPQNLSQATEAKKALDDARRACEKEKNELKAEVERLKKE